ncbi:hypothetical protein [Paenibacillus sp. UNC451MF]|uniref:hypothetical protein n=1 Tax=Paenibacillus sp. UNC451MF TaxID=1449063 RepID=UPI00048C999C|nr:hypothetical protein [Paenibacillus sp. UNC451MF]
MQHLREAAKRGLGLGRIKNLKAAANRSVGIQQGSELAKIELKILLSQYEWLHNKLEEKPNFTFYYTVTYLCYHEL